MPGCGKAITITVPKGYAYKTIPFTCGMTGRHGTPEFCEQCAPKYAGTDWRRIAEENGEQFDEEPGVGGRLDDW